MLKPRAATGRGGRHRLPPPISGNSSWRGSVCAGDLRFLAPALERGLARNSATRRRIGQALAPRADQCAISALQVVDPSRNPVVVPKIELSGIAVQVRLADVEVAAEHGALEDAEKVLDRVGMPKGSTDVFLDRVID